MVTTHNLGFPRIGANRELKLAQEAYWQGKISTDALLTTGETLRQQHWQHQAQCHYVPVGDFSFYDHILDMSFLVGNIPARVKQLGGSAIEQYFRAARGYSIHAAGNSYAANNSHTTANTTANTATANNTCCEHTHHASAATLIHACEMTKWFDTNYHYLVPELTKDTQFNLNASQLLSQIAEATAQGHKPKPLLIGPVTYLYLSKTLDGSNKLELLEPLIKVYAELLTLLATQGIEWVQIDEPILVTELTPEWKQALERCYHLLKKPAPKILLATYFGSLQDNTQLACDLPVAGLHIDAIYGDIKSVLDWLPTTKVLSLGVINGRNIWKTDLTTTLNWLEPIHQKWQSNLWLAPSCSLLHVPVNLDREEALDPEIKNWLAFAVQKLAELQTLAAALNNGRASVTTQLNENKAAINARHSSPRVHNNAVKKAVTAISPSAGHRKNCFAVRSHIQQQHFNLPTYPTTTIGSFPQTQKIRAVRQQFKKHLINEQAYNAAIKEEIKYAIRVQETLGIDVLVHGEAERNDMVEYFGEQLEGFVFSQLGWVQSYGSRCVKPPIIFGDISRPCAMTVAWTQYAQSLTVKPVKGMLTGPVTILNWSFVRDDQPRRDTCLQIALAIREEVLDLEKAGVNIIQIDEAALREGLPLRQSQWASYLAWTIDSFRLCANGVKDETQIHTHMCYSQFNDIIKDIARMDADVITIETSRSNMALLTSFENFQYPNDIGPGVYDIHSPNIPTKQHIIQLIQAATKRVPAERLWVNPDCGLKTRHWDEVIPALQNMVEAAKILRLEQLLVANKLQNTIAFTY